MATKVTAARLLVLDAADRLDAGTAAISRPSCTTAETAGTTGSHR